MLRVAHLPRAAQRPAPGAHSSAPAPTPHARPPHARPAHGPPAPHPTRPRTRPPTHPPTPPSHAAFVKQEHRDTFFAHKRAFSWQFHATPSTSPDEHNSEYLAFQTTHGQLWVFGSARYDSVRAGGGWLEGGGWQS